MAFTAQKARLFRAKPFFIVTKETPNTLFWLSKK
jgi:hypothetical protein